MKNIKSITLCCKLKLQFYNYSTFGYLWKSNNFHYWMITIKQFEAKCNCMVWGMLWCCRIYLPSAGSICSEIMTIVEGHMEDNFEHVSKAKIRALPVPTVFYSHNPPLKQDRSKTNFSPDTSQTHTSHPQQFLSVRFQSCSQMSERYRDSLRPQAMKITCLVASQFKPSKSECQ